MLYPTLPTTNPTRQMIDVFRGYNHNLRINDNEFYDMENMASDNYPVLSPRRARASFVKSTGLSGMISKDDFCYVDGQNFIVGGEVVNMGLSSEPKTLVSMASYVIILPDKKYINTANPSDFGDIEVQKQTTGETTFSLCKLDGSEYDKLNFSPTAPSNPQNMDLWVDTSTTPNSLKQYSSSSSMWVSVASTYIKISSVGIGKDFEVGDGVTISGIEDKDLADLNATMVIQSKGDDFIVVIGILDQVTKQSTSITIKRLMPNLDFVIESGNRLWGCRYGEAQNGEMVNEIYASKLGDFKNWNSFQGISTDSYAASCGTDGQFTGAITHLGYPIFFKENCMHKVYGNFPANYQIQTTDCRGVQKGSHKSLAIVNEIHSQMRTDNRILLCSGTSASYKVGDFTSTGWSILAGSNFGVLKDGTMYAQNAHIRGTLTTGDDDFNVTVSDGFVHVKSNAFYDIPTDSGQVYLLMKFDTEDGHTWGLFASGPYGEGANIELNSLFVKRIDSFGK